jgi:DNA-binding MarR family transcriptional regulator
MVAERKREHRQGEPHDARPNGSGQRGTLDLGVLASHLGYFLRRLQIEVFKDFIQTMVRFDLRPGQYSMLVIIAANPGRSQAELGKTLNIERARVARLSAELERRGWVRRIAAVNDRRSHALFLTPKAQKSMRQIQALAREHEARIGRLVGTQRRQELLDRLKHFG